ncbi:microtubule nucleation factor SSNA1-like [Styela clava]|uniref:Sjoegren syndrome nuclear autoantigen 1 homolog n=1 Tax=Styela clava TaxID=7725 RepID=UPI0019395082|nr:Sjoegren syndrome nuclear autoantigen 1 homolog [Styela clava]
MSGMTPRQESGGATLQVYNNEMIKCIDDLCNKRDDLNRQIEEDNEEKARLHNDIRILTDRLAKLNEEIAQRMSSRNEFDRTIAEAQAAYTRIMDTSQTLLHSVQSAAVELKMKETVASSNEAMLRLPKTGPKRDLVARK